MITAPFDYSAPPALPEALELLASRGDDGKVLAGGHSLLPLMKLRLATPSLLVDLRRLEDLRFIRRVEDRIEIGAMTRYVDVEDSDVVARDLPLLSQAVPLIGDAQVRNRGTIGGAVVHADPAGDMPALVCVLQATIHATSPRGERSWPAEDFFQDIFTTPLEPDEIVTKLTFPIEPNVRQYYEKFRLRLCDWAIVGAAFTGVLEDGRLRSVRLALANVAPVPQRARRAEEMLEGAEPTVTILRAACDLAADGLDPTPELQASKEYKLHLATVISRRAMEHALGNGVTASH
ncbi:MAG TPA: xanthine dehydrogenase family protein subunit M [Chloroflexota bacterium]|nr:xanthine dehydrogenase family protein subunit M [Chloroflexota bacterium]